MQSSGLFYQFHFYLFGLIAIASALAFVTRKGPVAAALWLVNTLFSLAALYIMLDAQFIGAIQVFVYAGAIMVVFLFVVMLLNLGDPSEIADIRGKWGLIAAGAVGLALVAQLLVVLRQQFPPEAPVVRDSSRGVIDGIAEPLFREYLLAFEIASILLLAAIVGAVLIAKRRA
ncbi:MAG TPA: NADH-quinone oxidoreductase subunit J [Gemmatimonadaceae bacterium]|nr:NADH-quinone oxidoreductase subunit J [Gemmatimonadaceae bacterium]